MKDNRIRELARKYIEYDMIQTHTELPEYPNCRVRLLSIFLGKGSDEQNKRNELFALATSLVQMGLDTHDLIEVSTHQEGIREARSKQLKVLAGDYFSSHFYHLLSQAGQVEAIEHLSNAICEANCLKINLYTSMKQDNMAAEDYIEQTVDIKMQLFLAFSRYMEGNYAHHWLAVLQGFTLCEVLLEEIKRTESVQNFHGGWAYWQLMKIVTKEEKRQLLEGLEDVTQLRSIVLKYNIDFMLSQMLDEQLQCVLEMVDQFASENVIEQVNRIGLPFMQDPSSKVLEEI